MPTERMSVRYDLDDDEQQVVRFIDGKELPNWREGPGVGDYIQDLVREGWQIIEYPKPSEGPSGWEVILERQVP